MQHDLADRDKREVEMGGTDVRATGVSLDHGEQIRAKHPPGVGIEHIGFVGSQELVAGPDDPAQQQGCQGVGQAVVLCRGAAPLIGDDECVEPVGVFVRTGNHPSVLPTLAGMDWATYMPDTAWAVSRYPPDSSRSHDQTPVLMPSLSFDTSAVVRFRSPS
jgi:hypothetical protein